MGLGVASFSVVSQNLVLLGLAGELRVFGSSGSMVCTLVAGCCAEALSS